MTAETTDDHPTMTANGETASNDAADFDATIDGDESTVKFLPEKKDDGATGGAADAELGGKGQDPVEFTGLTKEDLQQFANDPFWVKVRYALFGIFIGAWIAILVAAILIVVFAPPCPPRPEQEWYHKEVVYNIYPRSFQDTNGDGVGDIKGIIQHLDYFAELGVKALWLSSIYETPQIDGGQDVTDHKAIDSLYGSLDDFKELLKTMKKKGMKLMMDFIPNHTSRAHRWFVESAKSKDNEYADYYVWRDGGSNGTSPPNNWLNVYGGSAWEKVDARGQYFLHQFQSSQPELNLRNPKVQKELMDVLSYWLDLGVAGFVVQNAEYLVEDKDFTDEPSSGMGAAGEYVSLKHDYTLNQPENFPLMYEWQELLDNVTDKSEKYRVLLVDAGMTMDTVRYMGGNETHGADLALNKNLLGLNSQTKGQAIKNMVNDWLEMMKPDRATTWMLGNQDSSRVATRMGRPNVNIANMLQLLLPGTPLVYYGSEIGMLDGNVTYELGMDKGETWSEAVYKTWSRDNERTPMQWNGSPNAGFTNGTNPWLPLPEDYVLNSVKAQRSAGLGKHKSNLVIFEELAALRTNASFQWGELVWNIVDDGVVSYVRKAEGFPGYLVILNFGSERTLVECHSYDPDNVPMKGTVVASSDNFLHEDFELGTDLLMDKLVIGPSQGVVFQLVE